MRTYTPEQDKILIALYPDHSNEAIAQRLGRSIYSVFKRAQRLKLKKSPEYLKSVNQAKIGKAKTAASRKLEKPVNIKLRPSDNRVRYVSTCGVGGTS